MHSNAASNEYSLLLHPCLSETPMFFRLLLAFMGFAGTWTLSCSAVHSQPAAAQEEPARETEATIRQVSGEGFTLDIIDNSPTFSQALAINASGQMIGVREVANANQTVFSQEYFFFDGKQTTKIPSLKDFTNIEVAALSDNGWVAGYASRPMGHPQGSLTAIVWNSKTGELTRLMPAAGDISSHAQDISADGLRVSGYTSGSEPPRLRPCVWTWDAPKNSWEATALEVLQDFNPYTMTSGVMISPDGTRVATCITVAVSAGGAYDSSLFMWEWSGDNWTRRLVSDEQMVVRDMNNQGEIAATYTTARGPGPCFIDADGKLTRIGTFAGDVSGEARGINASGTVVGFSDDPHGPDGGPQAFIWIAGKSRALKLPAGTLFSSAFGINDSGQIAGLMDVELPSPTPAPTSADGGPASEEAPVKTLAFRWTPQP